MKFPKLNRKNLSMFVTLLGLMIYLDAQSEVNNLMAKLLWDSGASEVRIEVWSIADYSWWWRTGAYYNFLWLALRLGFLLFGIGLWFWEDAQQK